MGRLPYSSDPQAPRKHSVEGGVPQSSVILFIQPNYTPSASHVYSTPISHKPQLEDSGMSPHTVILNVLCFAMIPFWLRFLLLDKFLVSLAPRALWEGFPYMHPKQSCTL